MIVDSSALVAIALDERGTDAPLETLLQPGPKRISAANLLETWMLIDRRESTPLRGCLADRASDQNQVAIAWEAWYRYGMGRGLPAQLSYGDCFAFARARNEPLLFIGNDFFQTDITPES